MSNIIGKVNDRHFLLGKFPSIDALPPGSYTYDQNGFGVSFLVSDQSSEGIIDFNRSQHRLFAIVDHFWKSASRYRDMAVPHKTGILLHGVPGSGKTAVMRKAIAQTIAFGGYALQLGDINELPEAISAIRDRGIGTPILVYSDDLDDWLGRRSSHEVDLTHVMDGVESVMNGVMFVATTNSLHHISDRLRRPGRFDYIVEIATPSHDERAAFIAALWRLPVDNVSVQALAADTEGRGIAELRQLALQRYIYGLEHFTEPGMAVDLVAIAEGLYNPERIATSKQVVTVAAV